VTGRDGDGSIHWDHDIEALVVEASKQLMIRAKARAGDWFCGVKSLSGVTWESLGLTPNLRQKNSTHYRCYLPAQSLSKKATQAAPARFYELCFVVRLKRTALSTGPCDDKGGTYPLDRAHL
jgi:hypothetical protein